MSNYGVFIPSLLVSSILAVLSGCGGGGGGDSSSPNTAPTIESVSPITVQTLDQHELQLQAKDAENQTLTYTLYSLPKLGTAQLDSKTGKLIYTAGNVVGEDTFTVRVSDGSLSTDLSIKVITQVESVFDHQFYKVVNPETGHYQVVRYNPNTHKEEVFSSISNVILGNRIFIMSAAKDADKTVYKKREYAIFLDPNASKEVRNYLPTGATTATEYTFYTDNILKRFDPNNPNNQSVIFSSESLPAQLKSAGLKAIGDSQELYLNETDIDNSYVELRAFERLPDTLKGELSDQIKNTYLTVRLSDGKVTQGRTVQPIVNPQTGATESVLVNYLAVSADGVYPADQAQAKRLQSCVPDLSTCKDVSGATGDYYFLAQNSAYLYLAKQGSTTLYAYDKEKNNLVELKGVTYPTTFDAKKHLLKFAGGHGGAGVFNNFFNMPNVVNALSEDNTSYLLINYNLDTQDPVIKHPYYGNAYVYKNAQILKLEGVNAQKVYDNGTGQDLGDASDHVTPAYNLTLTAVKNGHLFVEAAKLSKEKMNLNYQQGWINTATATSKNTLDNVVVENEISYFTALRVPAVAVSGHVYINETTGKNTAEDPRVYNIYKLSLDNPQAKKESVTPVYGRMYFERTAFRNNGVYEGNVLLWDKNKQGLITNATNNKVMGTALDLDSGITNVTADASGNSTLAGVGGLFGLHMTGSHGAVPLLTSGLSEKENSLKKVNQINGSWITD